MSKAQIDATVLLCWLLERDKVQSDGRSLFEGQRAVGAAHLLRERLLVLGESLEYVRCPECWMEQARVVREIAGERISLLCPQCEDITGPRYLMDMYKVSLSRFIPTLLNGLDLTATGMKVVEPDRIWRLGTTQPSRGKALTWYFARQLYAPERAVRMKEQIALEKTTLSSVVLTSSELPLPVGSPIAEFDVRPLSTLGHVSQSKFEFFVDRLGAPGPQVIGEADPGTTLRYVRAESKVFVAGDGHDLEPQQRAILLALMDAHDHESGKDGLKVACGSEAQRFSPAKAFDRDQKSQLVYRTFIAYLPNDEHYQLIVPQEDRSWLT